MSESLIRAAQAEAARLESELKATQTYRRLAAVRELIAAYTLQTATAEDATRAFGDGPVKAARTTVRSGSQAASVVTATDAYLRKIGRRAQTGEILEYLREIGQTFTSVNPLGSLSSALSHHALFDNKRGLGYGLTEWGGADTAPTNSGLFDDPGPPNFGPMEEEAQPSLETSADSQTVEEKAERI